MSYSALQSIFCSPLGFILELLRCSISLSLQLSSLNPVQGLGGRLAGEVKFYPPIPLYLIILSLLYLVSPLGFELNPHLEDWQGMSNTFNLGGLAGSLNPPSLPSGRGAVLPGLPCWFCFLQVGVTVAY